LAHRVIMHADLDYFYAQCEENLNPSIAGKPVVVCVYSGRTLESGVVSSCNYEARKLGVRAGIPIGRAKKVLGSLEGSFLPMNRPLYEQVSDRIMDLLKEHADSFEKVGIDEAYLDISSSTSRDFEQAREVALKLKEEVLSREQITCSIGIAPNKLLAKIASDYEKPDGLTLVRPGEVKQFLAKMSVSRIPGVGKKVEEKLTKLRVRTIDELSELSATLLIETFGRRLGNYLFRTARGEDDEPVRGRERLTQLSRIGTLRSNTRDLSEIAPLIEELAVSATRKLGENALNCRSIGIIAILDDLSIHSKTKTLETLTSDETIIKQSSRELIEYFLQSTPNAILRRVGVKLSGLSSRRGQRHIVEFLNESTPTDQ